MLQLLMLYGNHYPIVCECPHLDTENQVPRPKETKKKEKKDESRYQIEVLTKNK